MKLMTQYVIFEACRECNLSNEHDRCPSRSPGRYLGVDTSRELSDDKIIEVTERLYLDFGFNGMVGWHLHNEPLMAKERVVGLSKEIRRRVPRSRFVLWTNGLLIPQECPELGVFDEVRISNYYKKNFDFVKKFVPSVVVQNADVFDKRLDYETACNSDRCRRMFVEFIIDYYGNVRMCCVDWQGREMIGNVYDVSLDKLVERFSDIRGSIMNGVGRLAPETCRKCGVKMKDSGMLVPEVVAEIDGFLKTEKRLVIVCVPCGGSPGEEWMKHHSKMTRHILVASSEEVAANLMSKAALDGFKWGVFVRPDEFANLDVGVLDRDIMAVALRGGVDRDVMRLDMVKEYRRGRMISTSERGRVNLKATEDVFPLTLVSGAITVKRGGVVGGAAVVLTSYRVPEQRLKEHFRMNGEMYERYGVQVFVVSDKAYDVPNYARCLEYPMELRVFNLAATSNYGIRYAMDCGYEVVVKTDVDVMFSDVCLERLVGVEDNVAVVPLCRMVSDEKNLSDYYCCLEGGGIVSMRASGWARTRFNEGCAGYGGDDGLLVESIRSVGIRIDNVDGYVVWHMSHGDKATDKGFWNREDGFNPEMTKNNLSSLRGGPVLSDIDWGLPKWNGQTFVLDGNISNMEDRVRSFCKDNKDRLVAKGIRMVVLSDMTYKGVPPMVRFWSKGDMRSIVGGNEYWGKMVNVKEDFGCMLDDACLPMRGFMGFMEKSYLDLNPDVKKVVANGLSSGWEHYVRFGFKEGRNGVPLGMAEEVARIMSRVSKEPMVIQESLRNRVGKSSLEGFDAIGKTVSFNIYSAVAEHVGEYSSVLDFGCGCGRVLRHIRGLFSDSRFYGTDLDGELVEWCQKNLSNLAEFKVNKYHPPLPYEDGFFDFAYAISVFTHLTESMQFEWLEELRRVVRPGGRLVLSTHGDELFNDPGTGFFSKGKATNDIVDPLQVSFHTRKYIKKVWKKFFEIERIMPRGINWHQDLILCRRRP